MLGRGLRNASLSEGAGQTGRWEGLCDLSWVQLAATSREVVATRWDRRVPGSPAPGSGEPGAMFLGDAAGVRTRRADIDGPEQRSRFRKGYPARGEGAVPGQGLRESGGSGRPQGSRGGHGPRPHGVGKGGECPASEPRPPERLCRAESLRSAWALGGAGRGLPRRGSSFGAGPGRAERGGSPRPRSCRGCGRSGRRSCWGAPRRRSPRRRCGRPGREAGALPPWGGVAEVVSCPRLRSSCWCCWERCSAPEVSGCRGTLCPAAARGAQLPSRARRRRSLSGRRALPSRAAHLPAPAGRGALLCAAPPPPRFVRTPSRARTRGSRIRRVPTRRAGAGGVPPQAGARVAERCCPGQRALPSGEPAAPTRPLPPAEVWRRRARALFPRCERRAGPGRARRLPRRLPCPACRDSRRSGAGMQPRTRRDGPLKGTARLRGGAPGYLPRLGGDWESSRSALAQRGQSRSTKNSDEGRASLRS